MAFSWVVDFFGFSPLSNFIEISEDIADIDHAYTFDLLWIDENSDMLIIQNVNGKYIIGGTEFQTRDEAVNYAVNQLLPDTVYVASAALVAEYPAVGDVLKEWN